MTRTISRFEAVVATRDPSLLVQSFVVRASVTNTIGMKLVPKLTLALVSVMCAVLAVNAYFRVRREVAFIEADRVRDHEMVGRALGASVGAVWRSEGAASALAVIDAAESHFSKIDIRWIPKENVFQSCGVLWPDASQFAAAIAGKPLTHKVKSSGTPHWHTCIPIDAGGLRQGAIELTEVSAGEELPILRAAKDAAVTGLAIASASAILSLLLGVWFVGRPVSALVDKARRIGRGDFAGPVRLPSKDEFAVLADEMNAMCRRLISTLDQLRHADRLTTVGKLASGVAHELGTPLNVISARAAMISSGETSESEAKDYARVIEKAAQRMTNIIQQLLAFARKKGPQKARRNAQMLVQEAVDLLRTLARKNDVNLVVTAPPSEDETAALVDPAQFEQVVTNLVMNAIQAMPKGGNVTIGITRELASPPWLVEESASEYLSIGVRDEGVGIAPEHLPHIFEPFYTTKDVGEGTGLGLSVSYGIIQEHGGWISVASELGRGSTFTIFLPSDATS